MINLILVVDDDQLVCMQLRELLEAATYRVVEAGNGEEALTIYTQQQPDIVLLDAFMPGMDGFRCLQELQTLPGGDRTPILMITPVDDQISIERAFAVGAADFITKPIQWSVLRQRVRRLLEASQVMQDLRQQTEQAQMREMQLRMALEAARMDTWEWDILNNKITLSENLKALLGSQLTNFDESYETFINFVHLEDRDLLNRAVKQAIEAGTEFDIEYRIVLPDSSICWLATKGVVFRDSCGKAMQMFGIDMDSTKRKQAQKALEVHAHQQALVAELSQLALAGIDFNSLMQETVTLVAECLKVEYSQILELQSDGNALVLQAGVGWQPELVGTAIFSSDRYSQAGYTLITSEPVIVEDFRTETRFTHSHLLHEQHIISGLSVIIHGQERPFGVLAVHTTKKRIFNINEIYFLQATANVLATAIARQNVENALKESQQRWQLAVQGTNDGIWDWNVKTNEVFFSKRWKQMLGYEEQEISSHLYEWVNRIHPDDINWVMQAVQDHFAKKTPFYVTEHRVRCKNGTYKWVLDRAQALWDDHGHAVRMTGSHTDITERKLTEEKLRQSEERFQTVARATNDVIWDWDLLTDRVWWNEGVLTLFGYLTEQVSPDATWWYERIHPDDRQRIVCDIHAVIDSGQQFWSNEYRFCRADGSYAYIFDRGYVVQDQIGKPVRMIGAMMDISDRKRVQEELQRQNMRSRLFADITLKIRQSLQIDEILQTSVTEVQKLLHADRVLIFQLRPDGSGTVVKEAVVPGLPVVLGRNLIDPCFQYNYIDRYRHGRISIIYDIEQADIQACHREFLQQFAIKANLVVPIIQQNQLWGLLIAHQCFRPRYWNSWETELLRQLADQIAIALAQAKLLEQETRQREELSRSNDELQEFAFVASHDLQEPLRKIKTFGDRLKAAYGDVLTEQGRDYLERMQNATRRMQTLIEDLLTLSRVTTKAQPFVSVNLFQLTQEVLSDLEVSIQQTKAKVEIGELPTIKVDPVQMRQLLQNLIANALKFQPPRVTPVVKIYSQILPSPSNSVVVGTEQCQIIVEDNGIGFDEKYLDRIFNVFQRLHGRSEYDGTGIGLAICRKIVERHHGSITAKSKPGQGAKFIVTLPINLHS